MHTFSYLIIGGIFCFALLFSIASNFKGYSHDYLGRTLDSEFYFKNSILRFFEQVIANVILISHAVPMSIYVIIEIIKVLQVK